jgi:chemosensory pili system protein ChpA (sensor histidine kinase/response regulator)
MTVQQTVEINSIDTVLRELGPLIEQVQQTLQAALENERALADAGDVAERLREIRGTLQLLELVGPSTLVGESQTLAEELAAKRIDAVEPALEVLLKAVFRLPDYLDHLRGGRHDAPAVLLPLINELRAARGAAALDERAVFYPEIRTGTAAASDVDDAALQATARRLRPRFQRALLGWYRGSEVEQHLGELGAVLRELAAATGSAAAVRLWSVCGALTESLASEGLDSDNDIKLLMGRVERLLSRLVNEGASALEREIPLELLRNLLYHVARSGTDSERVREVKRAYRLDELLPDSDTRADFEGPNRELLGAVGEGIRDELVQVKDAVELYVHSEQRSSDSLEGLPERLSQVADTFSMLGLQDAHDTLQSESEVLARIEAYSTEEGDQRLQKLADVLLHVENDLTRLQSGGPGATAVDADALAVRALPDAEYRPLVAALVAAALDDLSKVREAVSAYCDDPEATKEAVGEVPDLLDEVHGAVVILPLEAARPLLESLSRYVRTEFIDRGAAADEQTQILLADVVAGLEYYLEAVDHDRVNMTHLLESAHRAIEALDSGGEPPTHAEDEEVVMTAPAPAADDDGGDSDVTPPAGEAVDAGAGDPEAHDPEAGDIEAGDIQAGDFGIDDLEVADSEAGDAGIAPEAAAGDGDATTAPLDDAAAMGSAPDPELDEAVLDYPETDDAEEAAEEGEATDSDSPKIGPATAPDALATAAAVDGAADEPDAGLGDDEPDSPAESTPEIEATSATPEASDGDETEPEALEPWAPAGEASAFEAPELAADAPGEDAPASEAIAEPPETAAAVSATRAEVEQPAQAEPGDARAQAQPVESAAPAAETGADSEASGVTPGIDPAASGSSQLAILGEEPDDEIVEVFIEEALGELDKINENLPRFKANPSDDEAVVVVRRAFHTLKGGGRLIGAQLIGEFSWAMENMLNRVIDHTIDATAAVLDTLDEAAAALPQLIEQLQGNRAPIAGIDELLERAHALSRGETPPPPPSGGDGPSTPPSHGDGSSAAAAAASSAAPTSGADAVIGSSEPWSEGEDGPARPYSAEANADAGADLAADPAAMGSSTAALEREGADPPPGDAQDPVAGRQSPDPAPEPLAPTEADAETATETDLDAGPGVDAVEAPTRDDEASLGVESDVSAPGEASTAQAELEPAAAEAEPVASPEPETESGAPMPAASEEAAEPAQGLPEEDEFDGDADSLVAPQPEHAAAISSESAAAVAASEAESSEDGDEVAATAVELERAADNDAAAPETRGADSVEAEADGDASAASEPDAALAEGGEALLTATRSSDDPLTDIFLKEAAGHQDVLLRHLGPVDGPAEALQVSEAVVRALHTLVGSAQTVEAEAVADVTGRMENVVKVRREQDYWLEATTVGLFREALGRMEAALDGLATGATVTVDDLVERLDSIITASEEARAPDNDEGNNELLDIFIEEGDEILEEIDRSVSNWRETPDDMRAVPDLQRGLHTLKGGARMASFSPISDLTHEVESLVDAVAEGNLQPGEDFFDLLQEAVDALTVLLEQARNRNNVARIDWLVDDLRTLREQGPTGAARAGDSTAAQSAGASEHQGQDASASAPAGEGDEHADSSAAPAGAAAAQGDAGAASADTGQREGGAAQGSATAPGSEQIRVQSELLDNLVNFAGEVSIYHARINEQLGQYRFNINEFEQTVNRLRSQLRDMENETESQVRFSHEQERAQAGGDGDDGEESGDFDPLEFDRYTRLNELSRSLSESVGDLDSLKEMLESVTREAETLLLQQSRVSSELQSGLMQTRMVRFDGLRARLARVVRQTASSVGKKVQVEMTGGELELDRSIQERIVAPLEHILRNAVSHGLESPEKRRTLQKPDQGTIRLDLHRGGTDIVLDISDDGAGIDPAGVRRKAIERGMISADDERPDNEIIQLILETGFSTSEEVTQISGRGVGMDVVDAEIRRLGGTLGIATEVGAGTRFSVRLPVTLAINQAVMVKAGDDTYAIPIASIEGVAQVTAGDLKPHYVDRSKLYEYAGNAYRVEHLGTVLGTSDPRLEDEAISYPVIMVRAGDDRVALHVDSLVGRREVVVKPLGAPLNTLPGISGATIMADGEVVLILDVGGLLRVENRFVATGPQPEADSAEAEPEADEAAAGAGQAATTTVLVVDDSITIRKVTTRILERNGYTVATAKDGVDAMSWMAHSVPELVLLDIEMPRMDGYEVATYVRGEERLVNVPIIMITSRTGDKHRERAEDIGVNRYLGKPYQETELMEHIEAVLGESAGADHASETA